MGETIFIIKIVLMALMVLSSAFIIAVVLKQSGNSDAGAITGSSSSDNDSFYGKNAKGRKEYKLKVWTYVSAILIALCSIAFVILGLID